MDLSANCSDMMAYIAASPSPRHCVAESKRRLDLFGFDSVTKLDADASQRSYLTRGGALIAYKPGSAALAPLVIVAHTDSPNLRLKPQPVSVSAGTTRLGVEVYGGALYNSWLDRDLGLAGHIVVRDGAGFAEISVLIDRPVLRAPQLAIHLDRDVNRSGLKLNPQTELVPLIGQADDDLPTIGELLAEIGAAGDTSPEDIVAFELMCFPVEAPTLWGWRNEYVASARIDNQLSCWAATEAIGTAVGDRPVIVALFDHEEVGSVSATGADSHTLASLIAGVVDLAEGPAAGSALCISSDCSHATHPNFTDRHDPDHQIRLNGGPAIKINANQRYATSPGGHARFAQACSDAQVPHQVFVSRTDMGCGSTVGPVTAARAMIETVDVGAPQLAMHSARETTGASDPGYLLAALSELASAR